MELEIVRADPAGNVTVFVMNPPDDAESRAAAVRAILDDSALQAEQVGFVMPPQPPDNLWTLEMMGGEFCGNASRSFGLLVAEKTGISGCAPLKVAVSGAQRPLEVTVDTRTGNAEIEMPAPLAVDAIEFNSRIFPLYVFDGISHVIAEDTAPDLNLARELLHRVEQAAGLGKPDACGILFYDSKEKFLRPAVWVRAAGTFVFESSCGSGSAALALWLLRDSDETERLLEIAQPGGTITVRVLKRGGLIQRLSIGGKVTLGEPLKFSRSAVSGAMP
jgi:diaminopimelate epimerase